MDQITAGKHIETFFDSGASHPTLGLVYGRRRIGKSTLLDAMARERGGFYWEATRGESAVHLVRLGEALGRHLGVGRLSFETWEEAVSQLLKLGGPEPVPVVLDEIGYLLEADPAIDSVFAAALGPAGRRGRSGKARLILCGSAMAVMAALGTGQAPLRGRAGLEAVMQPFDFREIRRHLGRRTSCELAARVYSVIGGVIGYYTDMVDYDLPKSLGDFDRWVAARVLSPAATLHHEATTLLAEDPTLSAASPALHHSILGAIATGSVTAGKIANRLRRPVSNLDPALKRLVAAGFVIRHEDPIRAQRPTYALADPFLQFHYAVLDTNRSLLRDRDGRRAWDERLSGIFDAQVRGPVFEEMARTWAQRHAAHPTLGGLPDRLGRSSVVIGDKTHELDLVVANAQDPAAPPAEREILSIGEAKAGETLGIGHLRRLETIRGALGIRAARARLLLFGTNMTRELRTAAAAAGDVELIDLDRLYSGE